MYVKGSAIVIQTEKYVSKLLAAEGTGHDWYHALRVRNLALEIAVSESGVSDRLVIELAALLHDIADWKFHGGDETVGPQKARGWLASLGVPDKSIGHVCEIITEVSFKGEREPETPTTIESEIVQDADRLDALGAIGIARTFAYGGAIGNLLYDPTVKPRRSMNRQEYKYHRTTTINHFYEKLLLLKDRLNTESAKEIAKERHRFMEAFLEQFFREWGAA